MMRQDPYSRARWLFLPTALLRVVSVIPCALAFIKNEWLHSSSFFWHNADFWIPCAGGIICGFLWMVVVAVVAPIYPVRACVASFVPGAWLAWTLMGETHFIVGNFIRGSGFDTRAPASITLDTSGTAPAEHGELPRYDAVLGYRAYNRSDQRALEQTLQTFAGGAGNTNKREGYEYTQ